MSVEVVLASGLPYLFHAVEIDGEHYWDGGFMGNPAIFPLIYNRGSKDVILVHINPIERKKLRKTAAEIFNRMDEISFNSSLMREMRAVEAQGWTRTGGRFGVFATASDTPGLVPVCRFYDGPGENRHSHRYSADPQECAATQAQFPTQWVFESAAVFYVPLPDRTRGACPSNSRAIYRFLNNANGLHHRYTTEVDLRDVIINIGTWTQEGYGNPPAQVVMCSPNS